MRHQMPSGVALASVLAALALSALALSGCYTQLALPPQSDVTQAGAAGPAGGDGEEYFPPSHAPAGRYYPEDQLFDPYYSGYSYWSPYSGGGSSYDSRWDGYGGYYNTPWWIRPGYWSGGGAPSDSAAVEQRRSGRQLWRAGTPSPMLPPPSSSASGVLSVPGGGRGGTGVGPAADSSKTQTDKKDAKKSGRQMWR